MKTVLLLMAQYEAATVPLEDICQQYFGCARHTAIQKAKAGTLPVPAFQMGASQKSTWVVHISDLAALIDKQRQQANDEWLGAA